MSARALPLLAALALALIGCAGDGPAANVSSDLFSLLQRDVLNVNCLGAGCHNAQSQAGGLILAEGFSYQGLVVNSTPQNPAARAAGLQRVVPFDPARSFLLIKLTSPGVGQGDRMPLGSAPLSPEDLTIVNEWIMAGAPPAQTPTGSIGVTPTPTSTATPALPTPTATVTMAAPTAPPETTPPSVTPSPSPTATVMVTLADVQAQVFTPHCLSVGCHTAAKPDGNMVLEAGSAFAALVDVPAFNFAAMNAGLVRVSPGEPGGSFLLIKAHWADDPARELDADGTTAPVGGAGRARTDLDRAGRQSIAGPNLAHHVECAAATALWIPGRSTAALSRRTPNDGAAYVTERCAIRRSTGPGCGWGWTRCRC